VKKIDDENDEEEEDIDFS